jgi:glycosyltransferase involved in cell wall biosynthesis
MTTIHILSSPHNPVHVNNRIDPFSIATLKFIRYMQYNKWNVVHYGTVDSSVECENVICLDKFGDKNHNVAEYNLKAAEEIRKRKKPGDLIACFYGIDNRQAAEANSDLKIVEPSIGYTVSAVFAPYRVFVSYAQMHMYYGYKNMIMNPSWFDDVIYNAITPDEFEFNENKNNYFLYFGRVIESKGIHTAIQVTEHTGQKLVIAGPGSLAHLGYKTLPSHVEYVGPCDALKRKELMKNAKALIGATNYVEPFGNMVVESLMSGTPVITTDWGGFTETVIHNKTGFRCREFKDFVSAIENIDKINKKECRKWAIDNCSDDVVHKKFSSYFQKVKDHNFYRA